MINGIYLVSLRCQEKNFKKRKSISCSCKVSVNKIAAGCVPETPNFLTQQQLVISLYSTINRLYFKSFFFILVIAYTYKIRCSTLTYMYECYIIYVHVHIDI